MNMINIDKTANNQSFFKLPLIFMATFFVVYFCSAQSIIFLTRGIAFDYIVQSISVSFISVMLLPTMLFFITAIFYCQKYRLHSVSQYGLRIAIIGMILALLYLGWAQLISLFYLFVISPHTGDFLLNNPFALTTLSFFLRIFGYVIFIFLLWLLFHIMAKNSVNGRTAFQLEGERGGRVYAAVYSLLMISAMAIIITLSFTNVLSILISQFGYNTFLVISVTIILVGLAVLFIRYILFYFATRHSFKRIEPTLKLGKLIVTVLVTYLFNFIAILLIASMIFLFADELANALWITSYDDLILFFIASIIVLELIDLILLFIFSRLSVKIMYG